MTPKLNIGLETINKEQINGLVYYATKHGMVYKAEQGKKSLG